MGKLTELTGLGDSVIDDPRVLLVQTFARSPSLVLGWTRAADYFVFASVLLSRYKQKPSHGLSLGMASFAM